MTLATRIAARLAALAVCLAASGCFVPGGGWTMRTGLDVRRYRKPSVFVELVDTRWDEYNRIAEMNLTGFDPRAVVTPSAPPGPGFSNGLPAMPVDPGTAPEGTNGAPPAARPLGEPNPLPGAPVDPLPPPPPAAGISATARRTPTGGPRLSATPFDNGESRAVVDDEPSDDDQNDAADRSDPPEVSSTGPARRQESRPLRLAVQPAAASRPAMRPAVSRLFSRPQ